MAKKGYCGVGIWHPQKDCNVGTLFRSAYAFGADFIFTVGRRYGRQCSDTVNSLAHLPYYCYRDTGELLAHRPHGARLVCVETEGEAYSLPGFVHPWQAVYLLGSEGGGLPQELLRNNLVVRIPSSVCLNVSVAGSVVLYDRVSKGKGGVA